jgi:hypothetical protein
MPRRPPPEPDGELPPLFLTTACMVCGQRSPLDPAKSLADIGWHYMFARGWLCPNCAPRDELGRARKRPGQPPKRT